MIEDEIAFVDRATQVKGPHFLKHLSRKGFSSHWFLQHWSAVAEVIGRHGFGPRVLDLGCGPGWTSIFLAGRGCDVTAVDVSPDMLAIARRNAERLGMEIDFRVGDMQHRLPIDAPYDAVLIFDALHHSSDERAVLRHAFNALRPGGKILLVEPDWFHAYSPHARHERRTYGTTERGMGYRRVRRSLKACAFTNIRRYFNGHVTCGGSLWARLKALGVIALTFSTGYPHRPTIVLAHRPPETTPRNMPRSADHPSAQRPRRHAA